VSVAVASGFAPDHRSAIAEHRDLADTAGPAPLAPPTQAQRLSATPVRQPAPELTPAPEAVSTAPQAQPAQADPAFAVPQPAAEPTSAPDASIPIDQQAAPAASPPAAAPTDVPAAPPAGAPAAPPADTPPGAVPPDQPDHHLTLRERILRHFPGLHPGGGDQSPDQSQAPDSPAQTPPTQNPQ
jgi:hypothetical protein